MTNLKSIYIFGYSGFAKEIAENILNFTEYQIEGFLGNPKNIMHDNVDFLEIKGKQFKIFDEEIIFTKGSKTYYGVIAIADGHISEKIYNKFKDNLIFPNILHPEADISQSSLIGIGNVFLKGAWISVDCKIGSFNKIQPYVTIGHDCKIGDFNQFNPKVSISGNNTIGDRNLFGTNSCTFQGINIGSDNIIGLGSSLLHSIKDRNSYIGNPAKKFKY